MCGSFEPQVDEREVEQEPVAVADEYEDEPLEIDGLDFGGDSWDDSDFASPNYPSQEQPPAVHEALGLSPLTLALFGHLVGHGLDGEKNADGHQWGVDVTNYLNTNAPGIPAFGRYLSDVLGDHIHAVRIGEIASMVERAAIVGAYLALNRYRGEQPVEPPDAEAREKLQEALEEVQGGNSLFQMLEQILGGVPVSR